MNNNWYGVIYELIPHHMYQTLLRKTSRNMIIYWLDYYEGSMIEAIHFSRIRTKISFYSTLLNKTIELRTLGIIRNAYNKYVLLSSYFLSSNRDNIAPEFKHLLVYF